LVYPFNLDVLSSMPQKNRTDLIRPPSSPWQLIWDYASLQLRNETLVPGLDGPSHNGKESGRWKTPTMVNFNSREGYILTKMPQASGLTGSTVAVRNIRNTLTSTEICPAGFKTLDVRRSQPIHRWLDSQFNEDPCSMRHAPRPFWIIT
jgi:hypothetical protein